MCVSICDLNLHVILSKGIHFLIIIITLLHMDCVTNHLRWYQRLPQNFHILFSITPKFFACQKFSDGELCAPPPELLFLPEHRAVPTEIFRVWGRVLLFSCVKNRENNCLWSVSCAEGTWRNLLPLGLSPSSLLPSNVSICVTLSGPRLCFKEASWLPLVWALIFSIFFRDITYRPLL